MKRVFTAAPVKQAALTSFFAPRKPRDIKPNVSTIPGLLADEKNDTSDITRTDTLAETTQHSTTDNPSSYESETEEHVYRVKRLKRKISSDDELFHDTSPCLLRTSPPLNASSFDHHVPTAQETDCKDDSDERIVVPHDGGNMRADISHFVLENNCDHALTQSESPCVSDVLRIAREDAIKRLTMQKADRPSSDRIQVEQRQQWLQSLPIFANSLYFREYVEIISSAGDAAGNVTAARSFPSWMLPENITDAQRRRPDHPDYNVSTVWVPSRDSREAKTESKHYTPAMEQYWDVKKDHFDKIIFFKIGKFYEIFYVDAYIANRICKLRWMGSDEKPHVGFPEPSLHQHAQLLVDSGFKVVVVEQMERPKELEERNRNSNSSGKKAKAVKREVCEVFTSGTLLHESMLPTEARLLMALVFAADATAVGFAFCDVSTCSFWIGHLKMPSENHDNRRRFGALASPLAQSVKALLHQVTPVEVVVDQLNCPSDILTAIKQLPLPPHLNILPLDRWDEQKFQAIVDTVGSEFADDDASSNIVLQNKEVFERIKSLGQFESQRAVVLLARYLEDTLLSKKLLAFGKFSFYNIEESESLEGGRLIMDAAAFRHLGILQGQDGSTKGTLLEYLNHTVTAPGYRLLKRWVTAPLCSIHAINKRLDAVEWFSKHTEQLAALRATLRGIPDIERHLTKVCTKSLQGSRGAVYFDDVHAKQFAAFVKLMGAFTTVQSALEQIGIAAHEDDLFPERLRQLCCPAKGLGYEAIGGLPTLAEGIESLMSCLVQNPTTQLWTLAEGVDVAYDNMTAQIRGMEEELLKYLEDLIQEAKARIPDAPSGWDGIRFVHTKFPYEIEVPEAHQFWDYVKKRDVVARDLTSSRQGYVRFRTTTVIDLAEKLEQLQNDLKDTLYGCQQRLFQRFYRHHFTNCLAVVASMAEVDVLSGFALLACPGLPVPGNKIPPYEAMCRPLFVESPEQLPILRLIQCRHPIVALTLPSDAEYVPNDIRLNDPEDTEGSQSFFLVTGPNMGGKSTLLRQACLAVIIAQLGAFVPALECVLSPVDRIFTRLGAYDSILEGKSTFLVELEETTAAVSQATSRSLAVLDELGRGTSTFDGTAIALAVAEHLAQVTKCRCLFATHFQLLTDELQPLPSVRCLHMAASLQNNTLLFLYKLVPGVCPKSHGIRIARLAGMSESIVRNAESKASAFCDASIELYVFAQLQTITKDIKEAIASHSQDLQFWSNSRKRLLRLATSPFLERILGTVE